MQSEETARRKRPLHEKSADGRRPLLREAGVEAALPQEFEDRMRRMLGEEFPAFLASYDREPCRGLRLNTLKADRDAFLRRQPFSLRPVPWAGDGFSYSGGDEPGKHPYHAAGVYYIQEPSAMAPAEYLGAQPGERVLDLCAAPGGKTAGIAAKMQGRGILVANEIHPVRAETLSGNVERMGIPNAIVTNETPRRLAAHFPEYFDRILVDAPCSGEGMFRKNTDARREWSLENVRRCAARQDTILDEAASMLRPGGTLVYSTCTFAPEENEGSVSRFLARHSEFAIVNLHALSHTTAQESQDGAFRIPELSFPGSAGKRNAMVSLHAPSHTTAQESQGGAFRIPELSFPGSAGKRNAEDGMTDGLAWQMRMEETIHIFPHLAEGEGHFLAVLTKRGHADSKAGDQSEKEAGNQKEQEAIGSHFSEKAHEKWRKNSFASSLCRNGMAGSVKEERGIPARDCRAWQDFVRENLNEDLNAGQKGIFLAFGNELYLAPEHTPSLEGLKILRPGLHLGTNKKNRFEPAHALALALDPSGARRTLELPSEGEKIHAYLQGQAIPHAGEKGWYLILTDGYSIGWGKQSGGMVKNHYPKGLRL